VKKSRMTSKQVVDLAERYLAKYQPSDYRILIDRSGVRKDEDGWWEVPIRPSKEGAPTFDWTGRSAEAAVDLDEAEGVHVLFM
jgi:hypothetical protein